MVSGPWHVWICQWDEEGKGKKDHGLKKRSLVQKRTPLAELLGIGASSDGVGSTPSKRSSGRDLRMLSPPSVHISSNYPSPLSDPFVLCYTAGNISVCYGCRQTYQKPCQPSYDLCVRHKEWKKCCNLQGPQYRRNKTLELTACLFKL